MKNKVAIITNGGGMNCSYSGGVLCAIAQIYNYHNPDILIGSSGSVGSLAYFTAKQYNSIENIWTNLLASSRLISLKRIYKIMDIDYLVDDIFKQQEPLDIDKIFNSTTRLFISATELKTGKQKYFTNKDNIFEALKASKAIPIITRKKVTINNIKYIDGAISTSFNINIKKAIEEGAKNIIIIQDGIGFSFVSYIFWKFYSLLANKNIKKALKIYCKPEFHHIASQKNINMFIISPSKKLQIHSLNNKKIHLKESFSLGYNDLKNSIEFKTFFSHLQN